MSKVTLIYSDTEGWPVVEQFNTETAADQFVKEQFGNPEDLDWYNPAPILILEDHEIKNYDGFVYL